VTFAAVLTAKDHNAATACPLNLTQYSLYSVLYIEQGLGHVPKSCPFPLKNPGPLIHGSFVQPELAPQMPSVSRFSTSHDCGQHAYIQAEHVMGAG